MDQVQRKVGNDYEHLPLVRSELVEGVLPPSRSELVEGGGKRKSTNTSVLRYWYAPGNNFLQGMRFAHMLRWEGVPSA